MTSPLAQVPWESCLLVPARDPALEAYARRRLGFPNPTTRYFVRAPWVARMLVDWMPDQGLLMVLDFQLADLIGLVVSQESSCRYCYAATRALLRLQGMSEERVQRLEQQLARSEVEPRLAAVARFARRMARCDPPLGAADVEPLRAAGFDDAQLREIAFTVAVSVLMNRMSTIVAVPPQGFERMPDRLFERLARPLLWRWLASHRSVGQPAAPAEPLAGPFGDVVRAFDGSPIAPVLRRTLEEMWASPALPRRCRALLLAVIARALGCEPTVQAARELLAKEGMSVAQIDQALAHLGGPGFEGDEAGLASLARATIWYEPVQLQRQAQRLGAQLDPSRLTDAIGVMALGNALCRLQLALAAIEARSA